VRVSARSSFRQSALCCALLSVFFPLNLAALVRARCVHR
jgi:hypothetical protein